MRKPFAVDPGPAQFTMDVTPKDWLLYSESQRGAAIAAVLAEANVTAEVRAGNTTLWLHDSLPADDLPTSETLRKHRDRLREVAEKAGRRARWSNADLTGKES